MRATVACGQPTLNRCRSPAVGCAALGEKGPARRQDEWAEHTGRQPRAHAELVAVPASFHVLHRENYELVAAAQASLSKWRFSPALDRRCRVPQFTQWILRP